MNQIRERQSQPRPLRLLSLDGGGVRGLSEYVEVKDIMLQLKKDLKLQRIPKPCDHFDLIGGTSTGGIIAVLLGRLRISIEECLYFYYQLSERIFAKERWGKGVWQSKYDHVKLEETLKETLIALKCDPEELMNDNHPNICNTFVTATPKQDVNRNQPTLFRTYPSGVASAPTIGPVKIWQALRATSAAPTFFESIEIDGKEYVDGGFGCNNPCRVVETEARRIWKDREIGCIISLGTGIPKVQSLPRLDFHLLQSIVYLPPGTWFHMVFMILIGWMDILGRVVTDCNEVHAGMLRDPGKRGKYFRFNLQQGAQSISLEAWEKLPKLDADTYQYLQEEEIKQRKRNAVRKLRDNQISQ